MLFETPTYTPEDVPTFERMQQELDEYNAAYSRGENPKEPEYDPRVFAQFRQWQSDRMQKKLADYNARKKTKELS